MEKSKILKVFKKFALKKCDDEIVLHNFLGFFKNKKEMQEYFEIYLKDKEILIFKNKGYFIFKKFKQKRAKCLKKLEKIKILCKNYSNPQVRAQNLTEKKLINLYLKNDLDFDENRIFVNFKKLKEMGLNRFLSSLKRLKNIKIIGIN